MKNLMWILLLGNVILFAAMKDGWFGWGEPEGQAQPELNSEMIRLLPVPQSAQTKSLPAPIPVSQPELPHIPLSAPAPVNVSPEPAPVPPPSMANPPLRNMGVSAAAKPNTQICLEWGDFSGTDLKRATAALSVLQLADKLSQRKIERDTGYWVHIPPLANKAAINRKIGELKALGIKEYFVVQTQGNLLHAISLGVFKTRDSAQNFLDYLRTKGVRSAKVGEHASKFKATVFMLNKVDAATEAKLMAMQKDFAGTELNKVLCALTN